MNALADGPMFERRAGFNGLAWIGGVLATTVAAVIGAVLAVFFAATVTVIALMSAALLGVVSLALRARRLTRARSRSSEPDILEARNVGGHSWVAYGWDRQGR